VLHCKRLASCAAAAFVLTACGPPAVAPRTCESKDDCAADAWCRARACVASVPPTVALALPPPEGLRSHRVVRFDASSTFDRDQEDRVASWRWSVAAAAADCDPAVLTADGPILEVRFDCGGEFDVAVAAADTLGVESAPTVKRVSVALEEQPLVVEVGPDVERNHRCAGAPPACTPVDDAGNVVILLQANATSSWGNALRYAWSCAPPAGREGTVDIGLSAADVPTPVLTIRSAGAIAGEYACAVEVADESRGIVNRAVQHVRVLNRAPVVTVQGSTTEIVAPHAFAAATGYHASAGTPPLTVVDPDGDPLVAADAAHPALGYTSHPPEASSGFFVEQRDGPSTTFHVYVPAAAPERLIGPGVSRRIEYRAMDVNGAEAAVAWEVRVANRPPRNTSPPQLSVDHWYDPGTRSYAALASGITFVDDDGDPLVPLGTTHPLCRGLYFEPGTTRALIGCEVAYDGGPSLRSLATAHGVGVLVKDPWATTTETVLVTVRNRSPTVATETFRVPTSWSASDATCAEVGTGYNQHLGGEARGALAISDPDGDPVTVGVIDAVEAGMTPAAFQCAQSVCPEVTVGLPAWENFRCANGATGSVTLRATDGASEVETAIGVLGSPAPTPSSGG
jgi:hypothetical protein